MRKKVWATYRQRGGMSSNPAGWANYYEACADAVEHVAALEGKPVDNSFRRMALKLRDIVPASAGKAA